MDFKEVYKSLLELFPQIDARVLRAVAIEHGDDADNAVTAVLEEIIPFFAERSGSGLGSGNSSTWSIPAAESSEGNPNNSAFALAEMQNGDNVNTGNQESSNDAGYEHNDSTYGTNDGSKTPLMIANRSLENQIKTNADIYSPDKPIILLDKTWADAPWIEVSGERETEETISRDNSAESVIKISSDRTPCQTPETLQDADMGIDEKANLIQESEEVSDTLGTDCGTPSNEENDLGTAFVDGNNFFDGISTVSISPLESSIQLVEAPNVHDMSNNTASKMATAGSIISTEDVSTTNAAMSQSSQIQAVDVLEEIISHSRNNKKTLFSAMESVISLMREVALKEEAADKAKVEAAKGGADMLDKAEELKRMLQHAKQTNDMHAGEVYGEKAILATELKELQAHVRSLLHERDKALGVLDEISQTLKERLVAAQNVINSAEQEKLEKEEAAQKSLTDLELVMEKVVQESKTLKQQADDNSKLQEFLLDRGHVVDMLHGEIAVICQDVRLLKDKFDSGVPLTKSIYSSHTSFILASSTTTSIPDRVQEAKDHEHVTKEKSPIDERNTLHGWDFFD